MSVNPPYGDGTQNIINYLHPVMVGAERRWRWKDISALIDGNVTDYYGKPVWSSDKISTRNAGKSHPAKQLYMLKNGNKPIAAAINKWVASANKKASLSFVFFGRW